MKKFEFRLQSVLDYRENLEKWAKDAYLDAKAQRLEGEAALSAIGARRAQLLDQRATTVEDRIAMQNALAKMDDDERAQQSVIQVLITEEMDALDAWHRAKRDFQVMEKMREQAEEEWKLEAGRKEQAELDEWATTRKAA